MIKPSMNYPNNSINADFISMIMKHVKILHVISKLLFSFIDLKISMSKNLLKEQEVSLSELNLYSTYYFLVDQNHSLELGFYSEHARQF